MDFPSIFFILYLRETKKGEHNVMYVPNNVLQTVLMITKLV